MVAWLERHQVPLYLATMVLGAALGLVFPAATAAWELAVPPLIAVLLWSTFLGIPLTQLGDGLRDRRFLLVLLGLNFLVVPVVAWLLTRPLTGHPELVLGILVVLLVPCIDWVIVFAGLAGGDRARLTAAAPLLMLAQMLLLGPLLWLLAGSDVPLRIEPGPFLSALVWMLLVPLGAAVVVQLAARRGDDARASCAAQGFESLGQALMVPALMLVLLTVIASQVAAVRGQLAEIALSVPVYVAFLVLMTALTVLVVRAARLPVASARAAVFSATARNSLVVLPLAVAVADQAPLIPLAVVMQTMVELVGMVMLVRLVPRLLPSSQPATSSIADDAAASR
ncbi:arsenic resistance protein [Kocuria palustris]|uniref:arsenic resistance protein n=1 Tax=Kocuria palustris TaxID=71999 RepID=UPI0021A80F11|nr:arsenic resistance protein [Kocuria palustris]MCT1590114.1 arsenic resistance protein [Kocuria palustris]